jgi:capsid protein
MSPISDSRNADKQRRYRERLKRRRIEGGDAEVLSLTRAAIASGLAALDGVRPSDIAKRWYDDRVELVLRAASSPTALSTTPALAQVSFAFLTALTPISAGAALLERGIGLNFAGAAQITVPNIAIPNATFVGEGKPIPVVTAPTSAGATLTPHKIAVIAALTGEMMRSTNAEALVRQALIEATGPALDKILFSANAATADAPAGLLNGIAALTPGAAGQAKGEILVDDLQKLATAIGPVSGNGNVVLVASPDAAAALVMRLPSAVEWPVLQSASLPARTVIAVAAAAVVSAVQGVPQIDVSTNSAFQYDDAPGEIVNIGGVASGRTVSMYQTDEVALKLRWPISWALRNSAGLAWMSNVNW